MLLLLFYLWYFIVFDYDVEQTRELTWLSLLKDNMKPLVGLGQSHIYCKNESAELTRKAQHCFLIAIVMLH